MGWCKKDETHWSYVSLALAIDHYSDVLMSTMASQITSGSIICSNFCSGTDQKKLQSSTSLAFVRGIHRWPVNSLHKGPVTRKMFPLMFPFDDVIMCVFQVSSIWYVCHCSALWNSLSITLDFIVVEPSFYFPWKMLWEAFDLISSHVCWDACGKNGLTAPRWRFVRRSVYGQSRNSCGRQPRG